jgi:hypothetical protein
MALLYKSDHRRSFGKNLLAIRCSASIGALRRLISILLLAVFGLPFVPQLLASTAKSESNLPACCRRNGKHHCMMSASEKSKGASGKAAFSAPLDKCPYAPATVAVSHHPANEVATSSATYAEVVSHPSVRPQTESRRRISQDRSRSKRGPPTVASL